MTTPFARTCFVFSARALRQPKWGRARQHPSRYPNLWVLTSAISHLALEDHKSPGTEGLSLLSLGGSGLQGPHAPGCEANPGKPLGGPSPKGPHTPGREANPRKPLVDPGRPRTLTTLGVRQILENLRRLWPPKAFAQLQVGQILETRGGSIHQGAHPTTSEAKPGKPLVALATKGFRPTKS